jgi:hypothetical protein
VEPALAGQSQMTRGRANPAAQAHQAAASWLSANS